MPDENVIHNEERLSFFLQQQLVNSAKKAFLQLVALLKNAALYPPAHPFLLGSADQVLNSIEEFLSRKDSIAFRFISGELFFEKLSVPLEEKISQLVEEISRRAIAGVVFQKGLRRDELVAFAFWHIQSGKLSGQVNQTEFLEHTGISHIKLELFDGTKKNGLNQGAGGEKKALEIYNDGLDTVKEIVQSIQLGKPINTRRVQEVIRSVTDNILDNRDALMGLTSIKLYDEYTFAHSVNVAILATAMGSYLALEKSQIAALGIAGMLHDIGKVNIPIDIINKSDSLTDSEWKIVQRHPVEGALILSGLPGVGRSAMVTAFEHHRRYDLKGYPSTEEGNATVQPFSSIVTIADAYDALTALRVYYKIQRPPNEAIRILLNKSGTSFDPVLVKAFVNMVGIFPSGTVLRLNTGETGLVTHQTRDLLRPWVILFTKYDGTEREEVSLLEMSSGAYKRTAVGTLEPLSLNIDIKKYFC